MLSKKYYHSIDLLIIIPPARVRSGMWAPLGAMYIASALRQKGCNVQILNLDVERIANAEIIEKIKQINPRFISYSCMVATSYKFIKNLSYEIKNAFPEKLQILGGGLSSAAEILLKHTAVDIVVYGEGDVTIVELMEYFANNSSRHKLSDIKGIYYKDGLEVIFSGKRQLILDMDSIPYPAFDSVDMDKYLIDGISFIKSFTNQKLDKRIYDKNRNRRMINIITSRGCIGSCGFCARVDAGLRMHSTKYVFDLIDYCKDKFNVGFFSFGDECFAPTKERNWDFINEFKRRNPDIIFRIAGLRVDAVDEDIIKAYREIGCCMINFGFESGSQKMLNIIDKRVAVEQNRKVVSWLRKAGMYTPPQFILGMPGETNATIRETIDFLKSLDYCEKEYKFTYALAFPGSQLYDYAKLTKAIEDEDGYLVSLGEITGTQAFHINLTDEKDRVVAGWRDLIKKETYDHYFYMKYGAKNNLIKKIIHLAETIEFHARQRDLRLFICKRLKQFFQSFLKKRRRVNALPQKYCQFRKKINIKIEDFLKDTDCSSVNRDVRLAKINEELSKTSLYGLF